MLGGIVMARLDPLSGEREAQGSKLQRQIY
jgi:hypothetical protein